MCCVSSRKQVGGSRLRHKPLPPPPEVIERDNAVRKMPNPVTETAEKSDRTSSVTQPVCPICLTNPKDMAFSCGHTVSEIYIENSLLAPMEQAFFI